MIQLEFSKTRYAPIEELPNEVLGKIIKQMIPMNQHQLPTALRAIQSFGKTSKRIYAVVSSEYINGLVIYSILMKYDKIPSYLFNRLNAVPLRKYVLKNGLDKVFRATLTIRLLVLDVLREARVFYQSKERIPLFSSSNDPMWVRDVLVVFSHYPLYRVLKVLHPFGKIVVYSKENTNDLDLNLLAITEAVIKCVNASFYGIFKMDFSRGKGACECLEPPAYILSENSPSARCNHQIRRIFTSDVEPINQRDIESKKGGRRVIFSRTFPFFSCYKIYQSFGQPLPRNRCEDHRLMQRVSDMLHRDLTMFEKAQNDLGRTSKRKASQMDDFPEFILDVPLFTWTRNKLTKKWERPNVEQSEALPSSVAITGTHGKTISG